MKRGFTLIELLAVIIILAIVALIATPIILDVVEDARKSAATSETNMIISGVNNYCTSVDMKIQMGDNSYTQCAGTADSAEVITDTINAAIAKGEAINKGNAEIVSISYNGSQVTDIEVRSNGYTCTMTNSSELSCVK